MLGLASWKGIGSTACEARAQILLLNAPGHNRQNQSEDTKLAEQQLLINRP